MKKEQFAKIKNSRTAIFACAFLIPFFMMVIFWAICGIYPFGPSSILTGDMDIEFTNFYAYFIHTLKSNNDWSYMLTKTLGGDYPGLAAFILHDPLLFILLPFQQENIAFGIEVLITIQVSIAGLCASVLLNNRYKVSWMSLLFSTGYAFSAFFFGYLVLTIYFTAIAILPLVLYFFLEYLDERKTFVPFVISAAVYIYINYHMGFMLVIFLVILYVSKIICDTSYTRRFWSVALSGITVLLIDGYFLIRTGLSLFGEKTTTGADYGFYRRFPIDLLFGGMFSGYVRNDLRPLIYCSVAVFFFMIIYFLSERIRLREKLSVLFAILAVSVSMWINTFDAVWHGFNNPEGFYWRYAYYISICAVTAGYRGFVSLVCEGGSEDERKKRRQVIIAAAALFAYLGWITVRHDPYLDTERLIINAVLVAVVFAAACLMMKGQKTAVAFFAILLVVSAADELYNAKTLYLSLNALGEPLPKMADFKEDYRDIDDVISFVKKKDPGFYRIEKDFDRAINDPSMFDYVGLSHDSSCEKDELLDWLVNFGFCKTVYFTYYNGGSTSFTDDLFGVKYYISRFDSIEKPYDNIHYEGKYHAYENKNALPMAFVAPEGLADADISNGNTFEKQNLLAPVIVLVAICFVASALLAGAYQLTAPVIAVRQEEEANAAREAVRFEFADEQEDAAAALLMVDVPLARGGVLRRGALALPMEQLAVDGIVVVHGRGRVVLVRFVQRDEENIQLLVRQPFHAFTDRSRLHEIHGNQQLIPGIGTVQIQRAVEAQRHGHVNEVDLFIPIA